ncbi:hypothetical protein Tco_1197093 [Tanacetum coccineum]
MKNWLSQSKRLLVSQKLQSQLSWICCVADKEGKLKENQGCRVDTDQVHQNGDLKNRSVWIHPPGLQDVYTKET